MLSGFHFPPIFRGPIGLFMESPHYVPPQQLESTSTHLLRRAARQDGAAWRRLVDLYGPVVRYWIRRAGLADRDLPDVFQEVFLAIARNLGSFEREEGTAKFRAWLKTVTLSKVHDQFRRQGNQPPAEGGTTAMQRLGELPVDSDELDTNSDRALAVPEDVLLAQRALEIVRKEFQESTWQAFCLTTFDGLSSPEAAAQLSMTPLAVRKAKSRVLQRLKAALANSGPGSMSEMPE